MPQEFTTTSTSGCATDTQSAQEKARQQAGAAQGQAQATRQEAEHATRSAREQASAVADRARHGLGEAAETAKHTTADAMQRAQEGAQSFMVRQKDSAANEIEHVGDAVQRAAQKLHEEEDHNIASYVEAAASRAHDAARYLKQRDLDHLLADAQHLARQRPAIFYGGMFAAGLAIARFLKADSRSSTARRSSPDGGQWPRQQRQPITTDT